MDLSQDKKTSITLDLLHTLLSEMKEGAGSRLKPREVEVEATFSDHKEPDGDEDKDGMHKVLDEAAEEEIPEEVLESIEDESEDESEDLPEEEQSPAYARMQKRLGKK